MDTEVVRCHQPVQQGLCVPDTKVLLPVQQGLCVVKGLLSGGLCVLTRLLSGVLANWNVVPCNIGQTSCGGA